MLSMQGFPMYSEKKSCMKDYNGFSGTIRNKQAAWLRKQYAAGRPRPTKCAACGQDKGIFQEHDEDYSEPFGDHEDKRFPVCWFCHMMIHCRFRNPDRFNEYAKMVSEGWRLTEPFPNNFQRFCKVLEKEVRLPMEKNDSGSPLLLEIAAGKYAPSKRP